MTAIDKRIAKFYRKPIPNDITFDDVEVISRHFGCEIKNGGNHGTKVIHRASGTVIPIPRHGNCVGEAYIKELKDLFNSIKEETT